MNPIEHVWERFLHRGEDKERKIIKHLPPVFLRLFGDIDYQGQLVDVPPKFREKVVILTTSDTPSEFVESLQADCWSVVRSRDVTSEQAKRNASLLLNEAVRYGREQNHPYLFFLSSGFQRHAGMFYSMFEAMRKEHPNQDAYYFILPETHAGVSLLCHKEQPENIMDFLCRRFPCETALFIRTSMPFFETTLSHKGLLGKTPEGIPLGGMELFITLLDTYRRHRDDGKLYAPAMVGITVPMLTRYTPALIDWYRQTRELPSHVLDSLNFTPSLEVTSSADKLSRRIATFQAAMEALDITEADIHRLFSRTRCDLGLPEAFGFEDNTSPII